MIPHNGKNERWKRNEGGAPFRTSRKSTGWIATPRTDWPPATVLPKWRFLDNNSRDALFTALNGVISHGTSMVLQQSPHEQTTQATQPLPQMPPMVSIPPCPNRAAPLRRLKDCRLPKAMEMGYPVSATRIAKIYGFKPISRIATARNHPMTQRVGFELSFHALERFGGCWMLRDLYTLFFK
jgi:hypothetical protein